MSAQLARRALFLSVILHGIVPICHAAAGSVTLDMLVDEDVPVNIFHPGAGQSEFIMVREAANNFSMGIHVTIDPPNFASLALYRLSGATIAAGNFVSNPVDNVPLDFSNMQLTTLEIGFDENEDGNLDVAEIDETVPIRCLIWAFWNPVSDSPAEQLQSVPLEVLEFDVDHTMVYFDENYMGSRISGPVSGLDLVITYDGGANESYEEWFGLVTPVFRASGLSIAPDGLVSEIPGCVYSNELPTGVSDSEWWTIRNATGINIVHNTDLTITLKNRSRDVLRSVVKEVTPFAGKELRHIHGSIVKKIEDNTNPLPDKICNVNDLQVLTVDDLNPLYQFLILGGFGAGRPLSASNMTYWALGTTRDGYGNCDPDKMPSDYKLIPVATFSTRPWLLGKKEEVISKVAVQLARTPGVIDDTKLGVPESYATQSVLISLNAMDAADDDLKTALGRFWLRGLGPEDLPAGVEGGTWKRVGRVINKQRQEVELTIRWQIDDIYDWEAGLFFSVPPMDGQEPVKLMICDNWQRRFEQFTGNFLSPVAMAKPFRMGTRYEWPVERIRIWIGGGGGPAKQPVKVEEGRFETAPAGIQVWKTVLKQNVPNPFNPTTTIEFELDRKSHVELGVYDVSGRLVITLVNEVRAAGQNFVMWDGKDTRGQVLSTGVYFYRLSAGSKVLEKKMVLIR